MGPDHQMDTFIRETIVQFVRDYSLRVQTATPWREPLVAVADAEDPLFGKMKTAVSPTHALPGDLLPGARSVVCWFVPFTPDTALLNSNGGPAHESWAVAYVETNRMLAELSRAVAGALRDRGEDSAVMPPTHNYSPRKLMSDWSHKHVAWIAGLGRFGMNHLILTEQGCCGRLGSIITTAALAPTPRPGHEFCRHKIRGACPGGCVEHCPVKVLGEEPFNRFLCNTVLRENARRYAHIGLADVCGKCVCGLPCSHGIPETPQP